MFGEEDLRGATKPSVRIICYPAWNRTADIEIACKKRYSSNRPCSFQIILENLCEWDFSEILRFCVDHVCGSVFIL